jgi:hypothetical protein
MKKFDSVASAIKKIGNVEMEWSKKNISFICGRHMRLKQVGNLEIKA